MDKYFYVDFVENFDEDLDESYDRKYLNEIAVNLTDEIFNDFFS